MIRTLMRYLIFFAVWLGLSFAVTIGLAALLIKFASALFGGS